MASWNDLTPEQKAAATPEEQRDGRSLAELAEIYRKQAENRQQVKDALDAAGASDDAKRTMLENQEMLDRQQLYTKEQREQYNNVGGGDKALQVLTFGAHDPYKNAEVKGLAETKARQAREKVSSGLNKSVWDQPTTQQQALATLKQDYNQGVAGGQAQLAQQLMEQAQGKGQSIAEMQLRAGADDNLRNALSMQGAARGAGSQGAQRLAALQQSSIGNKLNQDAGILRLQEQRGAQAQLAGLYGQMGQQNMQNLGLSSNISEADRAAQIDRERMLMGLRQNEAALQELRYQEARGASEEAKKVALDAVKTGAQAAGSAITYGAM